MRISVKIHYLRGKAMSNVTAVAAEKSSIGAHMAAEFRQEAATTRRVLDRIPADKLNWRPHPKSLSLGQLALHIAAVPGRILPMLQKSEHEIDPGAFKFEAPKGIAEILATLDQSTKDAGAFLDSLSDEQAHASWTLKAGGRTLFTKSRMDVVRMIMLSHIYHHRGQLSVYLRLLDVPVPSIYGPSADDNHFM
jgi:uncharacterized damage-inducible protein DinB